MIRVREDKQDRTGTEILSDCASSHTAKKNKKKKQAEMGMDRVCESKDLAARTSAKKKKINEIFLWCCRHSLNHSL